MSCAVNVQPKRDAGETGGHPQGGDSRAGESFGRAGFGGRVFHRSFSYKFF